MHMIKALLITGRQECHQVGWLLLLMLPIHAWGQSMPHRLFQHGLASGDPLSDRVIIWTRVSPPPGTAEVLVHYQMARDSRFQNVVKAGVCYTTAQQDYTVKVDVLGLQPNQEYYYRFWALNDSSVVGRTRTAPTGAVKYLRLAVMSCSNYEDGYFHAYAHVARQQNLQAVLHLGDYIYESFYHRKRKVRDHQPPREITSLDEYRQRYAQYRRDPDLQAAHRMHPFITIWDDHEVSNNAHRAGAGGHNAATLDWGTRLAAAKQAYFEWMPIRDHPRRAVYRRISFGDLATLFMLDTRLEGRDEQIYQLADSVLFDPERSMLGAEQRQWLMDGLAASQARWNLLGNQVIFSPLYGKHIHREVENRLLDIWDGYPAERYQLTRWLQQQGIDNTLILTGDFHSSLAFQVPLDDWNYPASRRGQGYVPAYADSLVAVEFAVPSITSQNFDEFVLYKLPFRPLANLGGKFIENRFARAQVRDRELPGRRRLVNPHLAWVNLRHHGYLQLELSPLRAKASYYLTRRPWKKDARLKLMQQFWVLNGQAVIHEMP